MYFNLLLITFLLDESLDLLEPASNTLRVDYE